MSERLGRECLFLPSGRLALYLALRTWLRPGQGVLISPVTDDVIFFVVLAAGLRPVMAPVSAADGNIDLTAIPDQTWSDVSGVITTNLYGVPDSVVELRSRCSAMGKVLIEDAAHALESWVSSVDGTRRVGTFGEAAAFSLSKHVGVRGGGVLAIGDPARRTELEALRAEVTEPRSFVRDLLYASRSAAERMVGDGVLRRMALRAQRMVDRVDRADHRMPLRSDDLAVAMLTGRDDGPSLDPFDSWARIDLRGYRTERSAMLLRRMSRRLAEMPAESERRLAGVRMLCESEPTAALVAAGARVGPPQALFRVPLLVADREAVVAELERHGVPAGSYIYHPPLDDYAGEMFASASPDPQPARFWSRHVVPINPLHAAEAVTVLRAARTPAAPAGAGAPG